MDVLAYLNINSIMFLQKKKKKKVPKPYTPNLNITILLRI